MATRGGLGDGVIRVGIRETEDWRGGMIGNGACDMRDVEVGAGSTPAFERARARDCPFRGRENVVVQISGWRPAWQKLMITSGGGSGVRR
jgi:hypothetical protein